MNESSSLSPAPHFSVVRTARAKSTVINWESRGQETERFVLKIVIRDPSTMTEVDGMYFHSTSKNSRFPARLSASVFLKGKNFLRLT